MYPPNAEVIKTILHVTALEVVFLDDGSSLVRVAGVPASQMKCIFSGEDAPALADRAFELEVIFREDGRYQMRAVDVPDPKTTRTISAEGGPARADLSPPPAAAIHDNTPFDLENSGCRAVVLLRRAFDSPRTTPAVSDWLAPCLDLVGSKVALFTFPPRFIIVSGPRGDILMGVFRPICPVPFRHLPNTPPRALAVPRRFLPAG